MTFIGKLRSRLRRLAREMAKFGSVGAMSFVITAGFFNAFAAMGFGPLTSNGIATVIAATFSYFANRYWTFQGRQTDNMRRELVLFFVLNGVGLVITEIFIGGNHYVLGLDDSISRNVALVVGTGAATLFRYYAYKRWVFRQPATRAPRPAVPRQRTRPHLRRYRYQVLAAQTVSLEELFS